MRKLYWFNNDLRLHDNPGLSAQVDAQDLLLVYFFPVNRPWCNVTGMGAQRERFLHESLAELQRGLVALGQDLHVLRGLPEEVLPRLVRDYGVGEVATSRTPGYYERQTLARLKSRLDVPLRIHSGSTLFKESEFDFALDDLPGHFTPFKDAVADQRIRAPMPAPATLPPSPAAAFETVAASTESPHPAMAVRGGTAGGRRRLRQFVFEEQSVLSYKDTRNCLNALEGSSTLSPWLAIGALSPVEVVDSVRRFEHANVKNDSTEWLVFELLWREYFHWRALQDDVSLFRLRPAGGRKKLQNCTFEPRSFARWCAGSTAFPLVNALMHQLLATGWMSNRGRQIAASCLINELGIDWRYGAAFFEKHLLDFDVASNYGNWQYIAGVGADPRGGRHFDLDKQAGQYDPDGVFVEKWGGRQPPQPEYVTDAADWPIVEG